MDDHLLSGTVCVSDLVVVRGGGDLGSGVAVRLWRCGFRVVVLEAERPVAVRRTVAFAEAVYEGQTVVEEVCGRLEAGERVKYSAQSREYVPVVVDPSAALIARLDPSAVVDAILAKRNTGTIRDMARTVVALGPGFTAGADAHAVVETQRGPHLGRVIWNGQAAPNTGLPGEIAGKSMSRVLRAPGDGVVEVESRIGDLVDEGEVVARVAGVPVTARFPGLVRGLVRDGLAVQAGMKIGDLDPRRDPRLCYLVSDKALAIAGGVLEAILSRRNT